MHLTMLAICDAEHNQRNIDLVKAKWTQDNNAHNQFHLDWECVTAIYAQYKEHYITKLSRIYKNSDKGGTTGSVNIMTSDKVAK